jgi:hypothetical protein
MTLHIKVIEDIFWGSIIGYDENDGDECEQDIEKILKKTELLCDNDCTCVIFKDIDRGVDDLETFKKIIKILYPNIKSLWIGNNFVGDSGTYTFQNMYDDLNLDSLIVICRQGLSTNSNWIQMIDYNIKGNGLIAFISGENDYYYNLYGDPEYEVFKVYKGSNYNTEEFIQYHKKAETVYSTTLDFNTIDKLAHNLSLKHRTMSSFDIWLMVEKIVNHL